MAEAVADATVLIYLAKLGRLDVLEHEYARVLVPEKVREEVVEEGKKLGESDAVKVEEAIEDGWISVREAETPDFIDSYGLEEGENAVLSLARKHRIEEVLIDESPVREVAKTLGLEPRGTLSFLLQLLENGDIDFDGFLELLEQLTDAGFHMHEKVYLKAVREARKIAGEQ